MRIADCRPCLDYSEHSCLLSSTRQSTSSCIYMPARHHALTVRKTLLGINMHSVLQNMATNRHHYSAIRCLGPSLVRSMCLRQEKIVICGLMLPRSAHMLSRHHAFSRACQSFDVMHSNQKEPCSALLCCRCAHCVRASGAVSTSTPTHPLAGRCMGPPRCTHARSSVQTCTLHCVLGHRRYHAGDQVATDRSC